MGIAIGSGKIGFAYLVDGELMDWRLSIGASRSQETAFEQANKWIGYYQVDALVLQDPEQTRRGPHARALNGAIARAAEDLAVPAVLAPQTRVAANKYAEAAELAIEFPQIAAWLPDKRRLWEKEPRNIILFEALSLAWRWWRSTHPQDLETIDW